MAEVKVIMLGGRRSGKSTILGAMIESINNSPVAEYFQCDDRTDYSLFTGYTITRKIENLKKNLSRKESDKVFMTQTLADSKIQKYTLWLRLKDRPGKLEFDFYDVPGEFVNPSRLEFSSEMLPLISECDVFVIAIDTPYLMEATTSINKAYNRIDDLDVALQSNVIVNDSYDLKQVILVPVKCEKWVANGQLNQVVEKIKTAYSQLIDNFSSYESVSVSIMPVETIGGIHFYDFADPYILENEITHEIYACKLDGNGHVILADGHSFELRSPYTVHEDKDALVDGIKLPVAWYKVSKDKQYVPKNSDQLLLHILRFLSIKSAMVKKHLENQQNFTAILRGLINTVATWWKGIELGHFDEVIHKLESDGKLKDNIDGIQTVKPFTVKED